MQALKMEMERDLREAKRRKGRLADEQRHIGKQITKLREDHAFIKDMNMGFLFWAIGLLGFEKVQALAAQNLSAFCLRQAIMKTAKRK